MKQIVFCLASASLLSGCFTLPQASMDDARSNSDNKMRGIKQGQSSSQPDGLTFVKSAYLGSRVLSDKERKTWLTSKRVTYTPARGGSVSARDLAVLLREEFGLNVTSSMPLDTFTYTGLGVRDVDGETALRLLFTSMGLDYQINNDGRFITIMPMKPRTWTLSIGNRQTSYTTGASQSSGGGSNGGGSQGGFPDSSNSQFGGSGSGGGGNGNSGGFGGGGGGGGFGGGGSNGSSGQSDDGQNMIVAQDDPWKNLATELKDRLTILMPVTGAATAIIPLQSNAGALNDPLPPNMRAVPTGVQTTSGKDADVLFKEVLVGRYSLNPDTGAVTVQAPSWMLDSIGDYLDEVQATYNTKLTFEGKLLLLNAQSDNSEGLDIQAFIRWAGGRYGAVLSNPVLNGGVQVSFPSGSLIPSVSTTGATVAPTNLGIFSAADGLQIFNGYLESIGDVRTLQRPTVSTTHGVPVRFEKFTPETYSVPDQQVAAGGTGSAVAATRNLLLQAKLGTLMRVNPRYDAKTGLVRAQVYFEYNVKVGTDNVPTFVSGSNGSTTQTITKIPKVSMTKQSGEIIARDGDLVILSGTVEDSDSITNGGITGLSSIPLFGTRGSSRQQTTYYFAIRVKVERKGLKNAQ